MMDYTVICDMYNLSTEPQSWPSHVAAYHLTPVANVESILANGLTAKPCKATRYGDSRRSAVYLLAWKSDTEDGNVRRFLFGDAEVAVLEVRIPRSEFAKLCEDGLFNMSCQTAGGYAPTGMQYTDNIPAEWISK